MPVTIVDGPGVIFSEFPLQVTPGVAKEFTVRLAQQPTVASLRVRLAFRTEGITFPTPENQTSRVAFTDANWNTAQTVTVTMDANADAEYGQIILPFDFPGRGIPEEWTGLGHPGLPLVRELSSNTALSELSLRDFITDANVPLTPPFAANTTSYTATAPDRACPRQRPRRLADRRGHAGP